MTKEELRAAFPQNALLVDEFRRVFGPGVKVRWMTENGREVGRKGPEGVPLSVLPAQRKRSAASVKR